MPWEAKYGYNQKKTYYNALRGEEEEYIKKKPLRGDNYKKKKKNQMFAKAGKDSSDECYSKKKKKKQQKKTKKSKKKKQQLAIRKSKGKSDSDGYVVKEKKKLYPYKHRRILNSEVELSSTTAELSGNSVSGRIGLTKMYKASKATSEKSTTLRSGKSEKSGRISKCRTATKAGKESRSTGKAGKDSPTHVPSVSPTIEVRGF